jgi:3-hydroxyisobutyrate dehydrogenase-like beta-hydroxyacid dehydrogenase
VGDLIEGLYAAAQAQGFGRKDFSAVARLYQDSALPG